MGITKMSLAGQLLRSVTDGPDYGLDNSRAGLTEEQKRILTAELQARYKLWAGSWVIPQVRTLVPQLHPKAPAAIVTA